MHAEYRRWLWLGLLLFALWLLVTRAIPVPRNRGNWDAIGPTAQAAALAFLPPDSESGERRSGYTLGNYAWVRIHRSLRGDDSVRAIDYTVKLSRDGDIWRVIGATYHQNCMRNLWRLGRSCL